MQVGFGALRSGLGFSRNESDDVREELIEDGQEGSDIRKPVHEPTRQPTF